MTLKILLPTEVFLEKRVQSVTAEAQNGSFTLLPKHIDFATSLVPGILSFHDDEGAEVFCATDAGTLVKAGPLALVSTRNAAIGPDLGALKLMVEERFRVLDERERRARSAAARLEASLVRRFLELEDHAGVR